MCGTCYDEICERNFKRPSYNTKGRVLEGTSVSEFCIVLWISERYFFDMLAEMTWKYVKRYRNISDTARQR